MTDPDAAVITPGAFAGPSPSELCHRRAITRAQLAAAYQRAGELVHRAECALADNRILRRAFKQALRD